jgi:hypothetical protein
LDSVIAQLDHRDCNGSLDVALKKLAKVKADIEESRLKKNFKRVSRNDPYVIMWRHALKLIALA